MPITVISLENLIKVPFSRMAAYSVSDVLVRSLRVYAPYNATIEVPGAPNQSLVVSYDIAMESDLVDAQIKGKRLGVVILADQRDSFLFKIVGLAGAWSVKALIRDAEKIVDLIMEKPTDEPRPGFRVPASRAVASESPLEDRLMNFFKVSVSTWVDGKPVDSCDCGASFDRHFPNVHMRFCHKYRR